MFLLLSSIIYFIKPSKKDIVKSYGINADIDNELPKGIRLALGLGIANEDLAVIDAKKGKGN